MIRSAVTISLVTGATDGPFVFQDDLEASCQIARDLGFDGVELFLPDANAVEPARLQAVLDATSVSLAAVGTGAGWVLHRLHLCDPDGRRRKEAREFIRSIIDFGGLFNAPAIIGSMQGTATMQVNFDTARDWLCEALDDLGEHAANQRTALLLEPLNRYETKMVNTFGGAMELLNRLTTQNVRLLGDFFHMNIEESDMADALRAASEHLGHVHFVDSNRAAAGSGNISFEPLRDALLDIGYNGYLSAEARPSPDSLTAAKTTMATFKRLFR